MAVFENIATYSGTGVTSSVNFAAIPQTFKDLWVIGRFKATNSTLHLRPYPNGVDTNNQYNYTALIQGGSLGATGSFGTSYGGRGTLSNGAGVYYQDTGMPATFFMKLPNYTNSTHYKSVFGDWTTNTSGTNTRGRFHIVLKQTSAVTSLNLSWVGGNAMNYYSFTLFGMGN
jgi:hypothetical protein